MTPQTYRKLPGLVEAQTVPDTAGTATRAELNAVADWIGGTPLTYITEERQAATLVRVPTIEGTILAFPGDYIVKDGDRITVESAETFATQYVAAE